MTKTTQSLRLHFDFPTEYSLDNGTTWIPLAGDTPVDIPPADLPANKKAMVRSTDLGATHLDAAKLKLIDTHFDEVSIRNGKVLTTLETLFSNTNIGKLNIQNIPSCVNLNGACRNGAFKDVRVNGIPTGASTIALAQDASIGICREITATGITDASFMFKGANIKVLEGLTLEGAKIVSGFEEANIGYGGNIEYTSVGSTSTAATIKRLFDKAKFDIFPSVKLSDSSTGGTGSNTDAFTAMSARYIPSLTIVNRYGKMKLGAVNSGSTEYFPKYVSLNIDNPLGHDVVSGYTYKDDYTTAFGSLPKEKMLGIVNIGGNANNSLSSITDTTNTLADGRVYYDSGSKMAGVNIQEGTNVNIVSAKAVGLTGDITPTFAKSVNGDMVIYKSDVIGSPFAIGPTNEVITTISNCDNIVLGRDGSYARNSGANVIVVDKDGASKVLTGLQIGIGASFSSDCKKILSIVANKTNVSIIDIDAGTEKLYAVGSMSGAQEARAVYQANDSSFINVLVISSTTQYTLHVFKDTASVIAGTLVTPATYSNGQYDLIAPVYCEINEFCLVQSTTGAMTRFVSE